MNATICVSGEGTPYVGIAKGFKFVTNLKPFVISTLDAIEGLYLKIWGDQKPCKPPEFFILTLIMIFYFIYTPTQTNKRLFTF